MLGIRRFKEHLLANALNRDGQAPTLQAESAPALEVAPPTVGRRTRYARTSNDVIFDALAQKVLGAWAQNRHQTLYPLAMNFRTLSAADRSLLMQAIGAALRAGDVAADRLQHVQAWLSSVGGSAEDAALLDQTVAAPPPLDALIEAALAAHQGPFCYAVSLVALSQASLTNRFFLEYLAAKLAISGDVARSLAQRYRL